MKHFLLSALFLSICQTPAQSQFLWEKRFELDYRAVTFSAVETPEHDFLVVGRAYTSDDNGILLMKIASNGGLLWEKRFEGSINEHSQLIVRAANNEYVLTGHSSSSIRLVKVNAEGEVIWSKSFGPSNTSGAGVSATSDGGVVVLGRTIQIQNGDVIPHISVVKVDAQGNEMWSKNFTQYQDLSGEAIHQTSDGGYIIGGTEHHNSAAGGFLLKLKNDGTVSWLQKYTAPQKNYFDFAIQTNDGDYVLCGIENSVQIPPPQQPDAYIVRADADGNFVDFYIAGETQSTEWANHVFQNADNDFVLAGRTDEPDGNQNVFLAVVDNEGNFTKKCVFGDGRTDIGRSSLQASDGSILVTGYTTAAGQVAYPYLIKTNMECLTLPTAEVFSELKLSVYPNPTSDIVYFDLPETMGADCHIRVEDAVGCTIFTSEILPGKNHFEMGKKHPGVYYYHIFKNGQRAGTGKFVKL